MSPWGGAGDAGADRGLRQTSTLLAVDEGADGKGHDSQETAEMERFDAMRSRERVPYGGAKSGTPRTSAA